MIMNTENTKTIDTAFNKRTIYTANIYFANSPSLYSDTFQLQIQLYGLAT